MRYVLKVSLALALLMYAMSLLSAQQQEPAAPQSGSPAASATSLTVEAVIDRVTKSELGLVGRIAAYHPIVEVYIQTLTPDASLGTVPTRDDYFLGQFDGKDGPNLTPLSQREGSFKQPGLFSRP